jgi:uncharacterized protein YjbI with pentapeptide repeats
MRRSALSLLFATAFAPILLSADHGHKVLHARDFDDDPELIAESQQAVLLDNQLPSGSDQPLVRYRLDAGNHQFCLHGKDSYYSALVLQDQAGKTIFTMPSYQGCRAANLKQGVYVLRASHSTALPDPGRLTLVGVDEPSAPLHDANGNPLGGYWAITPLGGSSTDSGTLRPQTPPRNLGGAISNAMPLIADFSTSHWDESSLFSFPAAQHPIPLGPSPGFFLDMVEALGQLNGFTVVSGNYSCGTTILCDYFSYQPESSVRFGLAIEDLGHSQFTMAWPAKSLRGPEAYFSLESTTYSPQTVVALLNASQATHMWLQFRYYPDGGQVGTLNQGEVAFFESCNYQGTGVVATNSFNPGSYSIGGRSWGHQFFSVRLSNNTTVQLSTQTPDGDPSQAFFVVNDTACLSSALFDANLIYPLDKILDGTGAGTFSCPNCRLINANLSNFNMQGSNWQQADMTGATLNGVQFSAGTNLSNAKFIKASLSNVNFQGAILTQTDFTGATLSCVDFSGTAQQPRDLTQLVLANVQWLPSSSCRSNLSYTRLSTTIFPPALWKNANLTGAIFVDLKPGMELSTQANPLDLTAAILAGVNFQQASLDYAVMRGADLTGASVRHCSMRHVDLSAGKLFGAILDNANLDGASLSNAFLDAAPGGTAASLGGAFLRNVNLSGAQLSGADFTNASFFGTNSTGVSTCAITSGFTQGCASAARATLNNTEFSGAFLFGVDFSNATIQGVHFGNAFLIGSNFNNAVLTGDNQVGTDSGFPGAFLQGSNLQPAARLLNISLLNAYLDFSAQGNAFVTQLGGNHTVFPGSKNPGQPICVQMIYNSGTTVPTNNGTMTCPNGSQLSTGCGATSATNTAWESQVDISAIGSYQFDATYTPAQKQFCQPDPTWFTGGIGSVRK